MSKKEKEIVITIRTKDFAHLDPVIRQVVKNIKRGKEFSTGEVGNSQFWISLRYLEVAKYIDKEINGQQCKTIKSKI